MGEMDEELVAKLVDAGMLVDMVAWPQQYGAHAGHIYIYILCIYLDLLIYIYVYNTCIYTSLGSQGF